MFVTIIELIQRGASAGDIITAVIMMLIAILSGLCIHEAAHAYAAYLCGDDTAKSQGRLSLNPLDHIDPVGALLMFFTGLGWAKPVQIDPRRFRNMRSGVIITSLAGAFANFVLGFVAAAAYAAVVIFSSGNDFAQLFELLFIYIMQVNLSLCVFNLLPIPPLDGSRVVEALLPPRAAVKYASFARYSYYVLLGLIILERVTDVSLLSIILSVPMGLIRSFYFFSIENVVNLFGWLF